MLAPAHASTSSVVVGTAALLVLSILIPGLQIDSIGIAAAASGTARFLTAMSLAGVAALAEALFSNSDWSEETGHVRTGSERLRLGAPRCGVRLQHHQSRTVIAVHWRPAL